MQSGELRATIVTASERHRRPRRGGICRTLISAAAALAFGSGAAAAQTAFIPNYIVTSTVPANGDVNPYGVALVPRLFPAGGTIKPFDILVSNFNNKKNLQGTGTTIVKVTPNGVVAPPGTATVFFQSAKSPGLDTGLVTLQTGLVICAFLPSKDGTFATHQRGGLLVINKKGRLLQTIAGTAQNNINAPWDATIFDQGNTAKLFVANAGIINNGFITRLDLSVSPTGVSIASSTIIAMRYGDRPNAAGFVTAPTGLVYDPATDILYVASTTDNAIYAVPRASTRGPSPGRGIKVFADNSVLRGPLGMAQAANGDLVAAQSDLVNGNVTHPSEYVEFTKNGLSPGQFVSQFNIDVNQGGAFGIGIGATANGAPRLAVVNDNLPGLDIFSGAAPSINARSR